MPVKCTRLKADGTQCKGSAMKGSTVCYFHATSEEYAKATKKQDDALDIGDELKEQMRIVKKAKAGKLEKARLILDLAKLIRECEGGKTAPEVEKKPTPREILLGKGK